VLPLLITLVVAVGLLVSWSLYRNYVGDTIQSQVTKFQVRSDAEITITFQVVKDGGEPATCIVRARSEDGQEVGRAEVGVPAGRPGQDSAVVTYTLATSGRAVTGEVYGCAPGAPE
jgi:hypothetical protein